MRAVGEDGYFNFFLTNGVHKLQEWMKTSKDPDNEGDFV